MGDRMFRLADPEGGYWLYLPRLTGWRQNYHLTGPLLVDEVRAGNEWVHVEAMPETIEVVTARTETTGYKLRDGLGPTEQNPAILTLEARKERGDDDSFGSLYEPIVEERAPVVEPWPAPTLELVGSPPGAIPPGLTWHASLPYALRNHVEFLHLFPGVFRGVRDAVKAAVKAHGGDVHDYSGKYEVRKILTIPGETYMAKPFGGRRKVARPATLGVVLDLKAPPNEVRGENVNDAARTYHGILLKYTDALDALAGVTACPTCRTTGVIPKGPA